ncbi:MAG TPA: CdaR family protein [Symbiobacteriaceae bacterium]
MTEKLFEHPGWLKVLSVVLAIMLWAYVTPNYTQETSRTFSDVPLTILPHPTYELYDQSSLPDTVQIRAEGQGSILNRLKKEDLMAVVDLSAVSEPGKPTTLPIQVRGPDRVNYVVFPRTVQVMLVEHSSQMFPVTVEPATGTVTEGDKEYRYSAVPEVDQVSVSGRSDYLARVQQVQVRLESAELTRDKDRITKEGIPLDAAGNEVPGLTRPQVTVKLAWEELPPAKPFTVQPVTTGELPAGYRLVSAQADPATVSVRAQRLGATLPSPAVIKTEPIDLTGRTRTFTTTVRLVAPEGTNPAVETVTVTVTISETTADRVFSRVPLQVVGAPENLSVTLSTETVSVRVKGPYSVVVGLDAASLRAQVDLSGLGPGTHTVPVKVTAPAGANETAVDPAVVEVTLSEP